MSTPHARHPLQRRAAAFGLNLIVMAVCFALYYLGLFGGVEGPLSLRRIGPDLAGLGFTSGAFQGLLVVLFLLALSWNWLLNLLAHLTGRRLTCTQEDRGQGFCGARIRRGRNRGTNGWVYSCPRGHHRGEAHFHPLRKGRLANSLLMASLVCALMYYLS